MKKFLPMIALTGLAVIGACSGSHNEADDSARAADTTMAAPAMTPAPMDSTMGATTGATTKPDTIKH